ncbi:MAG: peptidoglycan-binding protein [Deltaproteobacteria bacterium]|nr:peptidoglycan-binding protein [Deltaproteobacteria bacterium]
MAKNREIITVQEVPYGWARKDLEFDRAIRKGHVNRKVRIVQEWLCHHGVLLSIDGDFGPITEKAVLKFQGRKGLEKTGVADRETFQRLTTPMLRALTPLLPDARPYHRMIVALARQHLAEHPREIGGENRGPWVRLYMKGNDGKEWLWCAGFVSFIMQQAADVMQIAAPIQSTFSCDVLAERAMADERFISERSLNRGEVSPRDIPPGSLFLCRRTPSDWNHVGIVTRFEEEGFETIEGNTNDEGSREGYEVCKRLRGYKKKDFIRL